MAHLALSGMVWEISWGGQEEVNFFMYGRGLVAKQVKVLCHVFCF